jgi:DNA polymerase (family 10)
MTQRITRAMQHPRATLLAHPSGRLLLEREAYELDWDSVFDAAAENDVALEFNSRRDRLDLDWRLIRSATSRGALICINPDAHTVVDMRNVLAGVATARKGWLSPSQVLNTRSVDQVARYFTGKR